MRENAAFSKSGTMRPRPKQPRLPPCAAEPGSSELFRATSAFPVYEDALAAAGIPYVTVAGEGFYDRPEIRDLLRKA